MSTMLKVVGADVLSIGQFEQAPGDVVDVDEHVESHRYRKLVSRNGRLIGAIVIGSPELNEAVSLAVKAGSTPESMLTTLPRTSRPQISRPIPMVIA